METDIKLQPIIKSETLKKEYEQMGPAAYWDRFKHNDMAFFNRGMTLPKGQSYIKKVEVSP